MKTKTAIGFVVIACLVFAASYSFGQYSVMPSGLVPPPVAAASAAALPSDAREIATRFEDEKAKIQKDARKQVRELRLKLAASLQQLQDRYAHDTKLDEAVAIRDFARGLRKPDIRPLPDPGVMFSYNNSLGRTLFFRVTGDNKKPVWGTNPYTTDSGLSSAAVHAGVLKNGQTGVVKVTMLPGKDSYEGSTRNGIRSAAWGRCPVMYKVEAVSDKDEDSDDEPLPAAVAPQPAMQSAVVYESRYTPSGSYTRLLSFMSAAMCRVVLHAADSTPEWGWTIPRERSGQPVAASAGRGASGRCTAVGRGLPRRIGGDPKGGKPQDRPAAAQGDCRPETAAKQLHPQDQAGRGRRHSRLHPPAKAAHGRRAARPRRIERIHRARPAGLSIFASPA